MQIDLKYTCVLNGSASIIYFFQILFSTELVQR